MRDRLVELIESARYWGAKIEIPMFVRGKVSVAGYPTYEEAVQEMVEAWNRRANDE